MPQEKNRFTAIWRDMKKAVEAQDHEGWPSPQIEQAHKLLLGALYIAAHNPAHPVLLEIVEKWSANLEQARSETDESAGPNGNGGR